MKVQFVHIRRRANADVYNKDGVLVVKKGQALGTGGATLAYQLDNKDMVVAIACAKCHINDNFCRRTGRVKAEGRLKSKRYRIDDTNSNTMPQTREEFLADTFKLFKLDDC